MKKLNEINALEIADEIAKEFLETFNKKAPDDLEIQRLISNNAISSIIAHHYRFSLIKNFDYILDTFKTKKQLVYKAPIRKQKEKQIL